MDSKVERQEEKQQTVDLKDKLETVNKKAKGNRKPLEQTRRQLKRALSIKAALMALLLMFIFVTAVEAKGKHALKSTYKVFHYGVYWPVQAGSFLLAGPVIVLSSVVQHCDDKLAAECESLGSKRKLPCLKLKKPAKKQ